MTDLESRILATVDALSSDLVSFARKLVQTPSLPGEEAAVQGLVADQLRNLGFAVDILPCRHDELREHPAFCDDGFTPDGRISVVGRLAGDQGGRGHGSLILNGHVDVVPLGELSRWSVEPWSGDIRDGRLYGRGSCDMKSGLAAGIFAAAALREAGVALAHDLLVVSVTGEETGGLGTLTAIHKGYRADGVVILEPTSLDACPTQSGALTFRLTVAGVSTHAAAKNEGVSAIEKFADVLRALGILDRERHARRQVPLFADPTQVAPLSVGTVAGGEWHSTVPARVVAEGRYGVFPGERAAEARAEMEAALGRLCANDSFLAAHPPRLEWIEGQFESGVTPLDHPLLGRLDRAHEQVSGRPVRFRGVTYGSDLRLFTNHGHMPAVLYGPGDLKDAHAADESVALADVQQCARAVALLVADWCGGRAA